MRTIPATMATQHPDNAGAPYWDKLERPFVSVYQEIGEAIACFRDLGVSEYMWDWEGKHADAAVIDRLFSEHYEYFAANQLGHDKFLTFRIPNIWEEKGYNLLQAMTVLLSSEDFARDLKFSQERPLFEVILPMTERADQLLHVQKLFEKLAHFKSKDFTPDQSANSDYLEMIPLVENVGGQLAIDRLLEEYVSIQQEHFGRRPEYIRAFMACSDSALSSGFLAALIGNKLGLARLYEFAARSGVQVFPILGSGGLPFRGGLMPATVGRFIEEFPGVRTVTLQSSFRYDHSPEKVRHAIRRLETELPEAMPLKLAPDIQRTLEGIAHDSERLYKATLRGIVTDMQPIFKAVPKRRDRRQHIGLVAYSRSMAGQNLPRAITFTGAFYSIGVPPEFIGFGRALKQLTPEELRTLREQYHHLKEDIVLAGRYLNRQNLLTLAERNPAWREVLEDVQAVEGVLGVKLGPRTPEQMAHQTLTTAALTLTEDTVTLSDLIERMASLRKSLG